jgi:hypothetical protein
MSKTLDLIIKDIANVNNVLQYYKNELEDFNSHLEIQHKRIDIAIIEQTGWYSFYDIKRIELKAIYEYLDMKLSIIHSIKWQKLTEKHNRELAQRDKEVYIKQDVEYTNMEIIVLHTKEIYEQYISAVESFKMRGYCLNNLTRLRVVNQDDWVV